MAKILKEELDAKIEETSNKINIKLIQSWFTKIYLKLKENTDNRLNHSKVQQNKIN